MTCCCDMCFCTTGARFSIKEVYIGMTADVGTLQRLPRIIAAGMARELAYTGREFSGAAARAIGFVNAAYDDKPAMMEGVMALARTIAAKSPLAIRGTKEMVVYARFGD